MNKLTPAQKMAIFARIEVLDPKRKLVAVSPNVAFTGGTVAYNKESGITLL
jgi:hypothetical protein